MTMLDHAKISRYNPGAVAKMLKSIQVGLSERIANWKLFAPKEETNSWGRTLGINLTVYWGNKSCCWGKEVPSLLARVLLFLRSYSLLCSDIVYPISVAINNIGSILVICTH